MFERLLTIASASPTSTEPVAPADDSVASSLSDVVSVMVDNLGNNGYQTGVALVAATAALIAMLNAKVSLLIIVPVSLGAFWAGWLGWNTFTAQDNPLFPSNVSPTKLWDVAFNGANGFLLVAGVACVAAIFLWKKNMSLVARLWLLLGAVLGASFLYNLVEAVRFS